MGPSYENRVFIDLSENKLISQPATTWDIAFWRNSRMEFGTRINDAQDIEVYQVSDNPSDWDRIPASFSTNWGKPLYNPDKTEHLSEGALEKTTLNKACSGQFNVGWGCYNLSSHHIDGKVIFVLKYPDGKLIKLLITDYFGGYTFQYAKAENGSWGATETRTISNGNKDTYFNYFSFDSGQEVVDLEPPRKEWDLMMTRYWTFYNNITMYRMSGFIQNPRIQVAKRDESPSDIGSLPSIENFSKNITSIGHSWKSIYGLIPNTVYYLKEEDKYYRLYFTKNGGASTGDMYFKFAEVTSDLSTQEAGQTKSKFGVFPNPSPQGRTSLIMDLGNQKEFNAQIQIIDMSGKIIKTQSIGRISGFIQKDLDLKLGAGAYILRVIPEDGNIETNKILTTRLLVK